LQPFGGSEDGALKIQFVHAGDEFGDDFAVAGALKAKAQPLQIPPQL